MVVGFLSFHSECGAFVSRPSQSTLCDLIVSRASLTVDLLILHPNHSSLIKEKNIGVVGTGFDAEFQRVSGQ